jgi:hypothetical protein
MKEREATHREANSSYEVPKPNVPAKHIWCRDVPFRLRFDGEKKAAAEMSVWIFNKWYCGGDSDPPWLGSGYGPPLRPVRTSKIGEVIRSLPADNEAEATEDLGHPKESVLETFAHVVEDSRETC